MVCFLACFGFSKKQKRRKPSNKVVSGDQRHGRYQPLDSDAIIKLDITDNPITSDSDFRDKPKEHLSLRVKKKVSFNLNVKTYEPIPRDETTNYFSESDEEENCEMNEEETAMASRMGCYPLNYRYLNCRDSYDEEDLIEFEESHLDDNEDDEEDNGDSDELSEQFCSLSMDSEERVTLSQSAEDRDNNFMVLCASPNQELKGLEPNGSARDRSQYVHSVLNPVENLTQWKAVKARAVPPPPPPLKHQRKENITLEQEKQIPLSLKQTVNLSPFNCKTNFNQSKPLMEDIAVDASLSNWFILSEKVSTANGSSVAVVAIS